MTAAAQDYDVAVVGGGPGGYTAAIRARQLGMSCVLIEREQLGGVCLNWGCIPTKALLRAAELRAVLDDLGDFGIECGEIRVDFAKLVARSRAVAERLSGGVRLLMKKNGITVVEGNARLAGQGTLAVRGNDGESEIRARHIILATGARARSLPGIEADGQRVWTYRDALLPAALPESLLIVGAGAIGVEFASFYADLGCKVTLVEMLPRILPQEDEEISQAARKLLARRKIKIHTGAALKRLVAERAALTAVLDLGEGQESPLSVERVLLAVGITGNVEDLGLEGSGVQVERGHVVVDEWLRTGAAGVYAIGDLVGPPWLAHKASHEALVCVGAIAGEKDVRPLDVTHVPACTYARPQVASVGLSEAAAREAGYEVRVGRFNFAANGKAIALGERDGFVKTVFDARRGELLGAHMIGADVTELIHSLALARTLEATEAELIETIFPHPTLSEMIHEAVLDAFGRVINS